MKQLILVRHAKSDWTHNVPDFERPLNNRGHKDASKMAKLLFDQNIAIDKFVSSPAKRALTTAKYFAETYKNPNIKESENLYNPSFKNFEEVISNLDNRFSSVAIFSHNFGISEFASFLAEETINLPTCGIAVFQIDCNEWDSFKTADKKTKIVPLFSETIFFVL
ncbi:MAG: histidine phosphatase family protein [Flavobacteriaceae bacterium]|jgi:phosphohistidine phosphatase|nr:histidine phosphatase family protein [Flavobacteriaceae bacterium]